MAGSGTDAAGIIAFTDGAASGNPGPGGWGVVLVTPDGEVTELGGAAAHTTNNRMEMTAAIVALEQAAALRGELRIHTDSVYLIRGVTEWVPRWIRNGWRTMTGGDVLNRDLWEKLHALVEARGAEGGLRWVKVSGHSGIPGNERVDSIAVAYTRRDDPRLFRGHIDDYDVPVLDLPDESEAGAPRRRVITRVPEPRSGKAARGAAGHAGRADQRVRARTGSRGTSHPGREPGTGRGAYSYLSLVDGVLRRHATWPECEKRVKGRSNAKFKKARSRADEALIVRAWGLDPRDLPPEGRRN